MQITFVFTPVGDVKAVSGYERDAEGNTFSQWRQTATTNLAGRELTTEVLKYLDKRLSDLDNGA